MPIISKSLFDRVQELLSGKRVKKSQVHEFAFRRLPVCELCRYSLIGEKQKGHTYYRYHTDGCSPTTIREERIEEELLDLFAPLQFSKEEQAFIDLRLTDLKKTWHQDKTNTLISLKLKISKVKQRQAKLTDTYLEDRLDRELFEDRQNELLLERKELEERLDLIETDQINIPHNVEKFLEVCNALYSSYESGLLPDKREIVEKATSNRFVAGKTLYFSLSFPSDWSRRGKKGLSVPRTGTYLEPWNSCSPFSSTFLIRIKMKPPKRTLLY